MTREELAYRLGFGARRRAEVDAAFAARYSNAYIGRPVRRHGRRGYRPRVYLRGGIGCIGCSVPLIVALAAVGALVAWMG